MTIGNKGIKAYNGSAASFRCLPFGIGRHRRKRSHEGRTDSFQTEMGMRSLHMLEDAMGSVSSAVHPSDHVMAVLLTGGGGKQVEVPAGARLVLFNSTAPFWAKFGAAAAVPATDILDGSAPELNPIGRSVAGIASIGLAASQACTVNLVFYG